jgi:hypothetical protein
LATSPVLRRSPQPSSSPFRVNRVGLTTSVSCPFSPDSDRIADIALGPKSAKVRHGRREQMEPSS